MNLTELKTHIYNRDAMLPPLTSDAQFMSLLDRAIVNVRSELREFEPEVFEVWLENQTSPLSFPSDYVRNEQVLFFPPDEYEIPYPDVDIYTKSGKWYVEDYTPFNVRYTRDIPRFTAMTQDLPFTSRKCEEILISETMAMIYLWHNENEVIPSVTSAVDQANRIN